MENEKITCDWQMTFCRQMFGSIHCGKVHGMIKGAIDGYIAHYGVYEQDVSLHGLWQAGIYFCTDNGLQERPNNEDSRVEIMDHLIHCFPRVRQ
jgi:hypothetical protein